MIINLNIPARVYVLRALRQARNQLLEDRNNYITILSELSPVHNTYDYYNKILELTNEGLSQVEELLRATEAQT